MKIVKKNCVVDAVAGFWADSDGRNGKAWIPDDLRSTAFRFGTGM